MTFIDTLRSRWQWAVALLVVVALGLAYAGQVQASAPAAAPTYRAVDLADAILFLDGPAAQHLTELERPKIEWTDEARRSREAISKKIESDEKWGESFASRIQSGDPNQIAPALHDLGVVSRQAMDELWGRDTMDKALDVALGGDELSGHILAWQRYVIIYRIAFLVRYVWVIFAQDFKDRYGTGNLPDEMTIRVIAQQLKAA